MTEAFAIACRNEADKFTPHSSKHCIAAERDFRPLIHLERKAWSENMDHDSEQTTERHYGKLPNERRFEVLEQIAANVRVDPVKLSDDDKIAFFDGILELIRNR